MELLERESALDALVAARNDAARGEGGVVFAPSRAAAMAAFPLPVATSRTCQPARMSAVSQSCSATSTMREATAA
jgi:hypothetical protein